ncbi:hypothetical protein KQY30_04690 [Streptomyces sp. GMY02]|uniref:hypothetical protein n=1 Tax=Streptomyces sp. GMY02 TaxID=1333528 RepID=UPI001C2C142B|nr:hypothetical protein [Streptomyces sp. GMY02]QXE39630.1 hypothetical protein KQY30_04690 [Streptomyces sp. GMY02]
MNTARSMNTALRITAFAAMLAAAFGVAYGVGNAVDPVMADPRPAKHEPAPTASPEPSHGMSH